ncbi:hypothetical protein OIU84_017806 [Salix udensis]|uniref:Uncharacterized protein n=1 Tax=Salix udensis TaxID=889485 RepID=A0AAD6L2N7_9ROSI|nr:hypothetical protein OIU84_017806 [Salix udensis]
MLALVYDFLTSCNIYMPARCCSLVVPDLNSKAVARLDLPHHSLLNLERTADRKFADGKKVVTEFVKFHVKKAEGEQRLQGRGDEISEKRRTMPSKSIERNSLAKKRLQELPERDSNKEEEAEKAIVP